MFINSNIHNKPFIQRQKFGHNSPDVLPPQNATNPIQNKEINLNNTPSVQNKIIVQATKQPDYKELQTFNIPNIGEGKIYKLKNGHKVIILPKAGNTVIHTEVNVGRANEPKGKEGISHLLEHVLFGNHDYEKMGGLLGGETTETHTNFWGEYPVENPQELEKMIEIQINIVQKNKISQETIDKEKAIIEQERNTYPVSFENRAIDKAYGNLFNDKYFPADPAGSKESLEKIKREDLVDHYNTFYTSDNMVTTIVGNVDGNTINVVSKYLSEPHKQSETKTPLDRNLDDSIQNPMRFDVFSDNTKRVEAHLIFAGPKEITSKSVFTALCMDRLIEKDNQIIDLSKKFDTQIELSHEILKDNQGGRHVISLGIGFEKNDANQGLKELYCSLFDFMQKPIESKQLEETKEIIKESLAGNKEGNLYLAGGLSSSMINHGNVDLIVKDSEIIDSITTKDVENLVKQTLDLNKVSMIVIHPQKTDAVSFKGNKSISQNIEEYDLRNNLHVVIDSSPGTTRTIASFKLIPSKEIKTKPGVESLLFMMGDNKDEAFNEATSKILGSTYIMSGTIETSAECSPSKTYTALWSLKNGINPDLSEENFEAQKKNIKRYLTEESEKPNNIAEEKLGMFWPAENRPRKEILNNFDNITLQDIQNYYKELKANSVGEVVLTIPPDLYKNDKQKILSTLSTGFPQMQKYQYIELKAPMPSKLEKSEMLIKPREDGEIIINKKFQIPYSQNLKDEETFALLNVIADKRINNDLRENQKLAYLAYSDIPPTNSNRIVNFHIQTSSNDSENLKKSLNGFSKITQDLIENKVSEKELNNAKVRLRIRNMNNISESAKRNEEINRGMTTPYGKDYLDENLKTFNEIQPEHIQRMAQMVFQKPSITIIEANRATLDEN